MSPVRQAGFAAVMLAICGCTRPNPAFDPDASASQASDSDAMGSTSEPTSTTTDATDATTEDPTSITSDTSAGPTTEDPTDDPTTGPETDTDTDTETTDTGEPIEPDCWDADLHSWTITELPDGNLGINPADPWISPDGLELYYIAGPTGDQDPPQVRRIFHSTRMSRDELFVNGSKLAEWPSLNLRTAYPNSNVPGELLLSLDYDLYMSVRQDNVWLLPEILDNLSTPWGDPNKPPYVPENIIAQESINRLTEDGSRLMFVRQDGAINPDLNSPVGQFYEALREPYPVAGTPFAAPTPTVLPQALLTPYPHPILCPALSPDGRFLLFSSPYPDEVPMAPEQQYDILRTQVITRPDVDSPWSQEILQIDEFSIPEWQVCPTSITRDGCEVVFGRFLMANSPNPDTNRFRIFIATREPV